jgi:hypothetical protein
VGSGTQRAHFVSNKAGIVCESYFLNACLCPYHVAARHEEQRYEALKTQTYKVFRQKRIFKAEFTCLFTIHDAQQTTMLNDDYILCTTAGIETRVAI